MLKKLFPVIILIMLQNAHSMTVTKLYSPNPNEISYLLDYPALTLGSKVPFSRKSDENGICIALGYEKAAVGTRQSDNLYRGSLVIVGANGLVASGEIASDYSKFVTRSLVCINKIAASKEETVFVTGSQLVHSISSIPYSNKSSQNSVCKTLGYEKAVLGTMRSNNNYRGPLVILNEDGLITSGEIASDYSRYVMSSLVCIKKI